MINELNSKIKTIKIEIHEWKYKSEKFLINNT